MNTYIYIHIYIHTDIYRYVNIYIYIYVNMYVYMYMNVYIFAFSYIYVPAPPTRIRRLASVSVCLSLCPLCLS